MDGVRVELCDECGFDAREPRDLPTAFAEAYASLEHLGGHPDASERPEAETWSGAEYVNHCVDVASQIVAICNRGAGRPESAPLVSISEVAAATAELVHELSDAQWDAATDGWVDRAVRARRGCALAARPRAPRLGHPSWLRQARARPRHRSRHQPLSLGTRSPACRSVGRGLERDDEYGQQNSQTNRVLAATQPNGTRRVKKYILFDHDGVLVTPSPGTTERDGPWRTSASPRTGTSTSGTCTTGRPPGPRRGGPASTRGPSTGSARSGTATTRSTCGRGIEIDGVLEALAELSAHVRMAVVTTARRADFELIHEKRRSPFMDFVLVREDYEPAKPHPEPYLTGLKAFGPPGRRPWWSRTPPAASPRRSRRGSTAPSSTTTSRAHRTLAGHPSDRHPRELTEIVLDGVNELRLPQPRP